MRLLVIDAMDAPHGGRILRLRHVDGDTPTVASLKGARMRAVSPDGEERTFRVESFAMFGGRPSDKRLARTGRADVRISEEGGAPDSRPIRAGWEVSPL